MKKNKYTKELESMERETARAIAQVKKLEKLYNQKKKLTQTVVA